MLSMSLCVCVCVCVHVCVHVLCHVCALCIVRVCARARVVSLWGPPPLYVVPGLGMWLVGSGLFICRVGELGGGVLRLEQRGGVGGPVLERGGVGALCLSGYPCL